MNHGTVWETVGKFILMLSGLKWDFLDGLESPAGDESLEFSEWKFYGAFPLIVCFFFLWMFERFFRHSKLFMKCSSENLNIVSVLAH